MYAWMGAICTYVRENAPNFTFICTRAHKKLNKRFYRFAEIY